MAESPTPDQDQKQGLPRGSSIALGVVAGVVIGVLIDNLALGIPIGIVFGLAVEAFGMSRTKA